MRRLSKMNVRPLAEDLEGMNLDPDAFLGQVRRTTGLVEHRLGVGNAPPVAVPDLPGVVTDLRPEGNNLPESGGPAGEEELEEQFKVVKKMFKTAGEKMKSKLKRKKRGLAKLARMSKMYRRKNKRKIAKRMKKKLAKFGAAGLERLHKMRKRVVMSADAPATPAITESVAPRSRIDELRENLNAVHGHQEGSQPNDDISNPYEEAAYNVGVLAMYLGEVFEAWGDEESANTMYGLSEQAAELSEMLDGFDEGDALEESQMDLLMNLLEGIEKGVAVHEEMGHPTVDQVITYRLEHEDGFMAECLGEEEDDSSGGGDPSPAPRAATEDDDDDPGAGLQETTVDDDD